MKTFTCTLCGADHSDHLPTNGRCIDCHCMSTGANVHDVPDTHGGYMPSSINHNLEHIQDNDYI